ncbi:MAG: S9 family peptidase [Candidatus Eremiobacteraeota bacterium]|nr:S9 family peptidase [Candidatus Eremiobacteraeota bacterium]
MTLRSLPILIALLVACVCASNARPYSFADAVGIHWIASLELAPNGALLYSVGGANVQKNAFETAYVLQDASGAVRKPTVLANASVAHWSPDGRQIAVVMPQDAGSVLTVLDARTLAVRRKLRTPSTIPNFSWSPDGRTIASVEYVDARDSHSAVSVWLRPDTDVLGDIPSSRQLWLTDVRTGRRRQLTRDRFSYGGPVTDHDPSWSADGTSLLAVRQPSALYGDFEKAEAVRVDVQSGRVQPALHTHSFSLPNSIPPQFGPDERILNVHTWDGTFAAREDLFIGDRDLSASFDHDFWTCAASQAAWDGRSVLATTMDGVDTRLYRFSEDGAVHALTPAGGSVQGFSVSKAGIAIAYSTPARPLEIYMLVPSGAMHQVTHINHLPSGTNVAPTKIIRWTGPDGHRLVGQLTATTDERALLTEPHGGPQCADDSSFAPYAQVFAQNGYGYFRPSVRGSDGYGDWSYKAIVNDFGPGPLTDLLSGVDAALAATRVNPEASFLYGASYGGYLTAFAVTHDRRFRAAVAGIPVTDLALDYALSESPNITRRFFGKTPLRDNEARMDAQSPVTAARDLQTPLLLMAGLRDTRAPYPQTIAFYRRLVEYGKTVSLLAYPSDGHGPSTPRSQSDWFKHIAGWFEAHGGPAVPGALTAQR